ncbi:MAG: CopG family transcriptional regulator [Pseudonocardia sp.]
MRTTLTLDDDVVAQLERLRSMRGGTFKDVVNDALRQGLARLEEPPRPTTRSFTRPVSLGRRPALPDVDDIAAVLAHVEGDAFR